MEMSNLLELLKTIQENPKDSAMLNLITTPKSMLLLNLTEQNLMEENLN